MAFLVSIADRAERDLDAIHEMVQAEHSKVSLRWFQDLERALHSLEVKPARCPITMEDPHLRHLLYGKKPHIYRIIYRLRQEQNEVMIMHIRHGARQPFKRSDLK